MATPRSLYLVRHAIAAERGDKWPDDSKRPLTHKGIARMRFGIRGLDALGVDIDLVMTSPLLRAVQTAEIVVRGLRSNPTMIKTAALAPGGSPSGVAEALASHSKSRGIAVVGHEPELGELAAWFISAR